MRALVVAAFGVVFAAASAYGATACGLQLDGGGVRPIAREVAHEGF